MIVEDFSLRSANTFGAFSACLVVANIARELVLSLFHADHTFV
jgi:hypothetical protein